MTTPPVDAPAVAAAAELPRPPRPRWRAWVAHAIQLALVVVVVRTAWSQLAGHWGEIEARGGLPTPRWSLVLASSVIVLATYALLAESWRRLVEGWGSRFARGDALRIYLVAKLGVYLPGKVWQVAAMGLMARRSGVAAGAAAGSALVGTVVNIAAGLAVLLVAGGRVVAQLAPGRVALATAFAALATAGLVALPWALPLATRVAARLTRRTVAVPDVPAATLGFVVLANVASWVGYGAGFALLARALGIGSAGNWDDALAVFVGSYLAGYLVVIAPGGLGVRELAMANSLQALGLAAPADAWILAFASRLWLVALEVAPGLLLLARDTALRSPTSRSDAPS